MMRVAALIATEIVSGPGRQLAALASEVRRAGVELQIGVLRRPREAPCPYAEYVRAQGLPCDVLTDRRPLDLRLLSKARTYLRNLRPTLVQTHGYKATALAFALRRSGERWPWIGCFHGATTEDLKAVLYHRLDRLMLREADRIIVMAGHQAHGFGSAGPRVSVIYNAVIPFGTETENLAPSAVAGLQSLPSPRIGVIGRLSPEKGVDVFLHAISLLRGRGIPASAMVIGDGPARAALQDLARRLSLGEHVRFLGHVRSSGALYKALDLVVLPSRSEGLPNVLLEALAMDRPVVATRVGAVPDVLTDPAAGVLIEPGNAQLLAEGIVTALRTEGEARRLARAAAGRAFSLEARAARHLDLYRDILGMQSEEVAVDPAGVSP